MGNRPGRCTIKTSSDALLCYRHQQHRKQCANLHLRVLCGTRFSTTSSAQGMSLICNKYFSYLMIICFILLCYVLCLSSVMACVASVVGCIGAPLCSLAPAGATRVVQPFVVKSWTALGAWRRSDRIYRNASSRLKLKSMYVCCCICHI